MTAATAPAERRPRHRLLQVAASVVIVAAVFGFALPAFADYGSVWTEIGRMTWLEIGVLVVAAAWNVATYWLVLVAVLPGLGWRQAALANQASTAVSNTLPLLGGASGVALSWAMYSSWGFTPAAIGLSVLVSGVWNNFVKLGMPVLALALVALQGEATAARTAAAGAGVAVLGLAVGVFALVLRREGSARSLGSLLGRAGAPLLRALRRPPLDWPAAVAGFRARVRTLLQGRWAQVTVATVVSHLSLWLVLLVALRQVGVADDEVGWVEVLASFAFVRLVQLVPITPGGLGAVELGYTATLVAAGGDEAQVVAAVLLFRGLTWFLPIPFGAGAYLWWRHRGAGRRHDGGTGVAAAGVEADERAPVARPPSVTSS